MAWYGLRLGLAAAIAHLTAVASGLDHPGWAPAACLLVARPQLDLLQSRGVGRVVSVLVGASFAGVVLHLDPSPVAYALLAVIVLSTAAATSGSRWYVTPAFATFFVFVLLVYGEPSQSSQKFLERVGETVLGVVLAYVFGWLVPLIANA